MPQETMTPKERWQAVMTRQTPDRIPTDYWATAEADTKLRKHLGVETPRELYERLHIDRLIGVGPRYVGPPLAPNEDMFGTQYRDIAYNDGVYREPTTHPLSQFNSVEEIEAEYQWPSVDWFDFSGISEQAAAWPEYPIRGGGSEPFLTYKTLRGMEQAYMDMALQPEIVHYCLDKLFGLARELTIRTYEALPGGIMVSYVAEDMGSQEGLLFSPGQIREFLIPRMKRMIDLAHSAGAYVMYHSDGAVTKILPDMIEAGIDILNPIQWRCKGMEREGLKANFGDQVIFHSAVDNQLTLPFGTVEDVRQEVRDNIRILGAGGGYIVGPCHNLQAISPAENMVAMYETAYEHGWS